MAEFCQNQVLLQLSATVSQFLIVNTVRSNHIGKISFLNPIFIPLLLSPKKFETIVIE